MVPKEGDCPEQVPTCLFSSVRKKLEQFDNFVICRDKVSVARESYIWAQVRSGILSS